MDLGLKDKVALVAGASKGLGFGAARALAHEGAKVSICSRDEAAITDAAARIARETGADVKGVVCDVTNAESIQAWIKGSVAAWGNIDALMVNGGGPPSGAFKDLTDAQWQAAFDLLLLSSIRMIRAALPHMKSGAAVLVSTSSSIREPIEKLGLSTVMRSGVAGLVKTLADELAGDGIRVNNIIPGRIDTERIAYLDEAAAKRQGISVDEVRKQSITKIPMKRLGTIDEYGAAAAFLLSPAAQYITGATLRVDGGQMRST